MQLSPQNRFQVYSTLSPFTLVCSIFYASRRQISQCIARSLQADCRIFQKSIVIILKNQDRYCQRNIKSYIITLFISKIFRADDINHAVEQNGGPFGAVF
jgi:hypothetical protein